MRTIGPLWRFFVRVGRAVHRWIVGAAVLPEHIGDAQAARTHHRPIPIELGFYLHADGRVYFRNRRNHTQRLCDNELLIDLVHREYAVLAELARKDLAHRTDKRKARAPQAAQRRAKEPTSPQEVTNRDEGPIDETDRGALP